jgi:hypothetical protein
MLSPSPPSIIKFSNETLYSRPVKVSCAVWSIRVCSLAISW